MRKLILGAVLAASAAAATLGIAGTASAKDWDNGHHYGWYNNDRYYDWRQREAWRERQLWQERHNAWLRAQQEREWYWRHRHYGYSNYNYPWWWDR